MRVLKELGKRILGPGLLGRIDFYRHPDMQYSWGGPFNGQRFRQRIFSDLLYALPRRAIIETGAFRGTTTALFAATSLPVYSVELQPRYFAYVGQRFKHCANVRITRGDSRHFLRQLAEAAEVPKDDVFFYLDAHWMDDLPLREELDIVFSRWQRPLVMIDDFQVPGDDYGYDDYGPDKALTLDYIRALVLKHDLAAFAPAAPAADESGARRGTIVLTDQHSAAHIAAMVPTLRRQLLPVG